MNTAIETHTGLMFDYAAPEPEQVCVEDIAHALALTCRFGGHINFFYSVAQHALLVEHLVAQANPLHPRLPALRRAALHHDSHEAYVGDIPTPMKRALNSGPLNTMVAETDLAICAAMGIDPNLLMSEAVVAADRLALRIEATALKINDGETFAEAAGTLPAHAQRKADALVTHRLHWTAREEQFLLVDHDLQLEERMADAALTC